MASSQIPFTRAAPVERELAFVKEVLETRALKGDGPMAKRCEALIAAASGTKSAALTHSCTAALELASLALNLRSGDEVIMPSYTFSSTANAVALRGAVPVFVDIRPDTLNLDEAKIPAAITPKTRAIYAVHYAGVVAEMDAINDIAKFHGLAVVEDAAQAYLSTYKGQPAGGLSTIGCFSFHETKNVVSGEGGALVTNDEKIAARVSIFCEKGTNRQEYLNGLIDKYTWVDLGSSYHPGELIAAFLRAQLEAAQTINASRLAYWNSYFTAFGSLEAQGILYRPVVPAHCTHNGHLFYLLLRDAQTRDRLLQALRSDGIDAPFHYVPLHSSPAGRAFGRCSGTFDRTDDLAARLIRLPLYSNMGNAIDRVIDRVFQHLKE